MGRVLAFFLIAVLLVALGVLGWFYSIARSALPQLDGNVEIPGLSARVTVIRDGHGVPTIEAANLDDLFFAQGYVTAQDRLWQMDMMRRFAAGEVSEILGDAFLKHDREQRILGLRVAAQKALEVASAQNRSHFEDYARGVNAYIRIASGPAAHRVPHSALFSASMDAGRFHVDRGPDGEGPEPLSLSRRAGAREDPGQARAGTDGRLVCELFLARPSAHRDTPRTQPG